MKRVRGLVEDHRYLLMLLLVLVYLLLLVMVSLSSTLTIAITVKKFLCLTLRALLLVVLMSH